MCSGDFFSVSRVLSFYWAVSPSSFESWDRLFFWLRATFEFSAFFCLSKFSIRERAPLWSGRWSPLLHFRGCFLANPPFFGGPVFLFAYLRIFFTEGGKTSTAASLRSSVSRRLVRPFLSLRFLCLNIARKRWQEGRLPQNGSFGEAPFFLLQGQLCPIRDALKENSF